MMHQPVDPEEFFSGRPRRESIIGKDEIISLKIDCEVLTIGQFYEKYFSHECDTVLSHVPSARLNPACMKRQGK